MQLSKTEEQLMQYLWKLDKGFMKDLLLAYPEPKPATTTVATLLKRMIDKGFVAYVMPEIGFDYKLIPSGNLVLATNFRGHINFGDDFEFYQAATIGANNGLRGYRNQRFTGKNAFVQSTDLRLNLTRIKTGWFPVYLGVYGGADYGRVWIEDDNSKKWNNSVGGGVFVNMANMMTGNISAFNSDDGLRLAFKLGFGF